MVNNAEALYRAREKRVLDAVELKVPDRVPVTASFYFFPARYYGCSFQEMTYNWDKLEDVRAGSGSEPVRGYAPRAASGCDRLQADAMAGWPTGTGCSLSVCGGGIHEAGGI
jgi:hypothetical protein